MGLPAMQYYDPKKATKMWEKQQKYLRKQAAMGMGMGFYGASPYAP